MRDDTPARSIEPAMIAQPSERWLMWRGIAATVLGIAIMLLLIWRDL